MASNDWKVNEILNDSWEIKKRVGKGTFCELFVARNIDDGSFVAVKVQNEEIEGPILKVFFHYTFILLRENKVSIAVRRRCFKGVGRLSFDTEFYLLWISQRKELFSNGTTWYCCLIFVISIHECFYIT